jgi:hypothetical protein
MAVALVDVTIMLAFRCLPRRAQWTLKWLGVVLAMVTAVFVSHRSEP